MCNVCPAGIWLAGSESDETGRGRQEDVAVIADNATVRVFSVDSGQQQTQVGLQRYILLCPAANRQRCHCLTSICRVHRV